ncbi:MAG: IS110 family transposase [Candidatus Limnocylindria bacterium]
MADPNRLVTLGIDTHAEVHAVAALDERGRLLDSTTIPTSPAGFQALLEWAAGFGTIDRVGIEGTGSYGAGVARWLRSQGRVVIEVDRPDRGERQRRGKSDPIDAEIAARAVQSGCANGTPKAGDGRVEAIRALRIARGSALDARSRVANQLHALRVTAPDELRAELRCLSLARLSLRASRFRVPDVVDSPLAATRLALRSLAQRFRQLSAEIARLDVQLVRLVAAAAPQLVARPGIGTQIAGQLLVTAGDNPTRLRSEGAFAMLVGTAPIPASSGKTERQRLNRSGDRQANSALYMLALSRLSRDARTQAYVRRRTAEGKTKPEIMRCLKRYLTREVYRLLVPVHG